MSCGRRPANRRARDRSRAYDRTTRSVAALPLDSAIARRATAEDLSSIAAALKALTSKRVTRKARDAVAAFAAEVGWTI